MLSSVGLGYILMSLERLKFSAIPVGIDCNTRTVTEIPFPETVIVAVLEDALPVLASYLAFNMLLSKPVLTQSASSFIVMSVGGILVSIVKEVVP